MTPTFSAVLSAIAILIALIALGPYVRLRLSRYRATARLAKAKPKADCTPPAGPFGAPGTLPPNFSGGTFFGLSVTIPAGQTILLVRDAILVSQGTLVVDGTIDVLLSPGAPISITLYSIDGDVRVGPAGIVGNNLSDAPRGANVGGGMFGMIAIGEPGQNGGHVRLLAPKGSVKVEGYVAAQNGGFGGKGTAVGTFPGMLLVGPNASAAGGQAGAGGDVVICALEAIMVPQGGHVAAGISWLSGDGDATAGPGGHAFAAGAPGNHGGDIHIIGKGEGTQVFLAGTIEAGGTNIAGMGIALGGSGGGLIRSGGDAEAVGGDGGRGGTVLFRDCLVSHPGDPKSQYGGDGGPADATGGAGDSTNGFGWGGGDGRAVGGNGGKAGVIPQQPLPTGLFAPGSIDRGGGLSGKSGPATSTGGNGGNAFFRGGSSGTGTAVPGTGGINGTTGPTVTTPSAPPTGGTGGVGTPASAPKYP